MKSTVFILFFVVMALSSNQAYAAWAAERAYIQLNNRGSTAWYDTGFATALDDFQGTDFGSFTSSDTFQITGAELDTWQSDGDNVNGAYFSYSIHSGATSFTEDQIDWTTDGPFLDAGSQSWNSASDKKWANNVSTVNILQGLSTGNYTIEIFYKATREFGGESYYNNGGGNFTATFDYTDGGSAVPEPTTFAMLGIATIILFGIRRKRQPATK